MIGLLRRTPREHSDRPLPGYKLAYPMLSADGSSTGFSGVTLGRSHVYGPTADAVCVYGLRHRSPSGWCDCGFYCFHNVTDAWELACEPEYRNSVLLEITVYGRYLRYEKGLRYARQRVNAVRVGRCGCGRGAQVLADTGSGTVGWRRLMPVCVVCAGSFPVLEPAVFGRLAGGIRVVTDDEPGSAYLNRLSGLDGMDSSAVIPLLSAEVALLQARLDEVQARLDRLTRAT